jgi:hypothetical protein
MLARCVRPLLGMLVLMLVSCRPPRVQPLQGAPAPVQRLPRGELPDGNRKIVFKWELRDGDMTARGDGVARIASPDSVRLDLFLGGGFGGGAAILIGDSLRAPGPDLVRKAIPPRALLWAALGRFQLPAEPDTVVREDGAVVRADIGRPARWRVSFRGDTLVRLERVEGGRLQEWVERSPGQRVEYRNEAARRSLLLDIQRSDAVPSFDPAIWTF